MGFLGPKIYNYTQWLYTIIPTDDQNKILGSISLLGVEYAKLIKHAIGVMTIAEAYKACTENMIGWKKVSNKTSNNTPQYFLT
jgi:hypothetical protein